MCAGVLAGCGAYRGSPNAMFTDADCGVGFRYPTGWRVGAYDAPYSRQCTFVIRPIDYEALLVEYDSVDSYTVWVTVVEASFESATRDHGFERRDENWVVLGRHGIEAPAAIFERPGWTGVRGVRVAGCYQVGGSYVGICESPAMVLGQGSRSVQLESTPVSEHVMELVAATVVWHSPGGSS